MGKRKEFKENGFLLQSLVECAIMWSFLQIVGAVRTLKISNYYMNKFTLINNIPF